MSESAEIFDPVAAQAELVAQAREMASGESRMIATLDHIRALVTHIIELEGHQRWALLPQRLTCRHVVQVPPEYLSEEIPAVIDKGWVLYAITKTGHLARYRANFDSGD